MSGSEDKTIKIWNIETGCVIKTLDGHTSFVLALKVLPNGYLISGSYDCTIKFWDVETGTVKHDLKVNSGVDSLKLLEDGRLVCGCENGTINIYE